MGLIFNNPIHLLINFKFDGKIQCEHGSQWEVKTTGFLLVFDCPEFPMGAGNIQQRILRTNVKFFLCTQFRKVGHGQREVFAFCLNCWKIINKSIFITKYLIGCMRPTVFSVHLIRAQVNRWPRPSWRWSWSPFGCCHPLAQSPSSDQSNPNNEQPKN